MRIFSISWLLWLPDKVTFTAITMTLPAIFGAEDSTLELLSYLFVHFIWYGSFQVKR